MEPPRTSTAAIIQCDTFRKLLCKLVMFVTGAQKIKTNHLVNCFLPRMKNVPIAGRPVLFSSPYHAAARHSLSYLCRRRHFNTLVHLVSPECTAHSFIYARSKRDTLYGTESVCLLRPSNSAMHQDGGFQIDWEQTALLIQYQKHCYAMVRMGNHQ